MPRLLALVAVLALAAPVGAQSLPDWAKPSSPTPGESPVAFAPDPPGGGGPVQQVPIDGGLGLLALAGGVYAARRIRSRSE